MATPLEKGITTGTEKLAQISLTTNEIEGSVNYSMGIANPLRTDEVNRKDPTIQPTIIQSNQATGTVHSYCNPPLIGILDCSTDITGSGRNFDNSVGINPQVSIMTTIPESNK